MLRHNHNICESKFFETIYNKYAKEIRRFLFYKTQDIDKSEDILQDVFIKLWENCNKVDPNKVKSYIYSIANNMFLNEVKHQKVAHNYNKYNKRESTNESPEFIMLEKEFMEKLELTIANLPEKQRKVFFYTASALPIKNYRHGSACRSRFFNTVCSGGGSAAPPRGPG